MPRQKTHQNPEKGCKIRKRVSSSSSSSSVAKKYRFKRAILVGKRVGSSTPVPTWKVKMAPGSRSHVKKLQNFENNGLISNNNQITGKEGFSARKLAATLWETNGFQSPGGDRTGFEKTDGSKFGVQKRRSSSTLQKLQITEFGEGLDTTAKFSSIEVGENNSSFKNLLNSVKNSLIASKELVKVLFRILSHEERNSSRITLVSALRVELNQARLQIEKMILEQWYDSNEIDTLSKNFAVWKSKGKERMKEAVSSIEIERKLRRQSERLNKKLEIELANTKAHLFRATKELEVEKRAKEKLEQTCDKLARGIGKERVEIENERKMLEIADVLREERVQMKLTDAKYEYEEKSADLDRLKTELEINKGSGENGVSDFGRKIGSKMKTQLASFRSRVDEESGESELHSIELRVDEGRRDSVDEEVFKGRRSLSDKIQWENICLQKSTNSDHGIEWEFSGKKNVLNQGIIRSSSHGSDSESSSISTGKSSCLREACNAILLDLASRKDYG